MDIFNSIARSERLDHQTISSTEREGDRVIPQQIHIFEVWPLRRAAKFDWSVSASRNGAPVGKRGCRPQQSMRRHRAQP